MVGFGDVGIIRKAKKNSVDSVIRSRGEEGNRSGFGGLYKQERVRTSFEKPVKRVASNNEEFITDLIVEAIKKKPKIALHCTRSVSDALPIIKKSILAMGYKVNMVRAYKNSEKNQELIPLLLSMVGNGILVMKGTKDFTRAIKSACRIDEIQMFSHKQTTKHTYKRVGKYAGVLAGKPGISKFRLEALDDIKNYIRWGKGKETAIVALKDRGLKPLYKGHMFETKVSELNQLTASSIAEGVISGSISKGQVKAELSKGKIVEVNKAIKELMNSSMV